MPDVPCPLAASGRLVILFIFSSRFARWFGRRVFVRRLARLGFFIPSTEAGAEYWLRLNRYAPLFTAGVCCLGYCRKSFANGSVLRLQVAWLTVTLAKLPLELSTRGAALTFESRLRSGSLSNVKVKSRSRNNNLLVV